MAEIFEKKNVRIDKWEVCALIAEKCRRFLDGDRSIGDTEGFVDRLTELRQSLKD